MRKITIIATVLMLGVGTSMAPAVAASWWGWGEKKKEGAAPIQGRGPMSAVLDPGQASSANRFLEDPDGTGWGTSDDPAKRSAEDQRLYADYLEAIQADVKKAEAERAARDAAEQAQRQNDLALLEAQEEKIRLLAAAARAQAGQPPVNQALSSGGAPAPAGPKPGSSTATIRPYVAPAPVKQWDDINKNAEQPAIKPYVVVPRDAKKDNPATP